MTHKILAIIDEDEVLKAINAEMDAVDERYSQQKAFVLKQVEDMNKKIHEDAQDLWGRVAERLRELGKLPENYDQKNEKHHLGFSGGAVCFTDLSAERKMNPAQMLIDFLGGTNQ